jgi:2-polyprenyl-3-methyl-5-hydroxy-6-metoxy-1,4-benzoquinol methylase
MWKHAAAMLACPRCRGPLELKTISPDPSPAMASPESDDWVAEGLLICARTCHAFYPVHRGVPILLRYRTAMDEAAYQGWPEELRESLRAQGLSFPTDEPPPGEKFVQASFSTEWEGYDYGQTLWTASTADRLQTFRGECGLKEGDLSGKRFLEVGPGLGILTNEAAAALGAAEAWGMDLSTSVFRAAEQFHDNPNVHFVQASVFSPPFAGQPFDFVYSHGVLHHTWSTREAVHQAAQLVRAGGVLYVWLYGYDDVRVSLPRRLAFALEQFARPRIARLPPSMATGVLLPLVPVYQVASLLGRMSGSHGTTYSVQQAIHAARDRFTPLFAHRHEFDEVAEWYREVGLEDLHKVESSEVPSSWAAAIARNVSIRGCRPDSPH